MREAVFLVEELSAKDLLEAILPKLIDTDAWIIKVIPFEGKQDLERRMGRLLRAWRNPQARFLVLRDQDSGNCGDVKAGLVARCAEAGKPDAIVRVACRTLEAWIVGDLREFGEEFSVPTASSTQGRAKYRNPDLLGDPVEELRSFVRAYQKRDGARRMGPRLDPSRNVSRSFQVFCQGVARLVA